VSRITAAMIMGAGMGSRMRPLTDDRPKPLVTVGGKSLIDHSIDRLVEAGITRVVVNLHYLGPMLRDHLSRRRDVEILFSDESAQLLDTGGGVVKAMPLLGAAPFFVLNSDSVWVESIAALPAMMRDWDESRMDGLLLLAEMATAMGYEGSGDFVLKADGTVGRARHHAGLAAYAYPGVQIVHPRMFEGAPAGAFSTNLMWDRAIARGRLFGTLLSGVWLHVGTPEARDEAEAYLRAPA
jgi:N-acetyl-alpha-D-muramate 1-phosphate uridylyltransferase